jgi:hypothetical protein
MLNTGTLGLPSLALLHQVLLSLNAEVLNDADARLLVDEKTKIHVGVIDGHAKAGQ